MANYSYTDSRNVMILRNIVYGEHNPVPTTPQSRIEAILLAILSESEYTEEAYSRMERILIAIANGEEITDMTPMSRNEDILLTKMAGDTYTDAPQSQIEEILIDWDISSYYTRNELIWAFGEDTGYLIYVDGDTSGKMIYSEGDDDNA